MSRDAPSDAVLPWAASHARHNWELKARLPDLAEAAARAELLTDARRWTETQTDTYFHAPKGRLKLREIAAGEAWLIGYARADEPEARLSAYQLLPAPDPEGLRVLLAATLGVRARVVKRRRVWLWREVRIHLDEVDGLGAFLEFEAVLAERSGEPSPEELVQAQARVGELLRHFGIRDGDIESRSYVDLMEAGGKQDAEGL